MMEEHRVATRPKLLLIGQAPGRGGDGQQALSGRAAALLANMAGIPREELLRRFDRHNLLDRWPGKSPAGKGDIFPASAARDAADRIKRTLRRRGVTFAGPTVLLVGKAVARAFGLRRPEYLTWYPGFEWCLKGAVIPHPSGINRWWNSSRNRRRASRFLKQILRKGQRHG